MGGRVLRVGNCWDFGGGLLRVGGIWEFGGGLLRGGGRVGEGGLRGRVLSVGDSRGVSGARGGGGGVFGKRGARKVLHGKQLNQPGSRRGLGGGAGFLGEAQGWGAGHGVEKFYSV